MAAKVQVRVQKNGVVVHQHEGANGFHDPSRKHGTMTRFGVNPDLHKELGRVALLKADGIAKLTKTEQAQYVEALGGKTFWIYPGKKLAAPAPELVADPFAELVALKAAEAEAYEAALV